jgi:uncharacterized protein YkwD
VEAFAVESFESQQIFCKKIKIYFMSFQGNWVDLVIVIVLSYFVVDSWQTGFWVLIADFASFLLSLFTALLGFSFLGKILESAFELPHSVANAIGFFLAAGIAQALFSFIFIQLIKKIPFKFWKRPWNNIAGIIPSLGQGLVLASFILTLVVSLPMAPVIKKNVTDSVIGSFLIKNTAGVEARLNDVFGGLAQDALTYLTVAPGSRELVQISYDPSSLSVDSESERQMFNLVNMERKKRGIGALTLRPELVPVARAHATDMWRRQYFSHYSLEGKDVADRLLDAGVPFQVVGENLALAPTSQTAHTGLMNSEGHRKNILDPDYKRMGIGVIDDGIYGKMFVQIFTN